MRQWWGNGSRSAAYVLICSRTVLEPGRWVPLRDVQLAVKQLKQSRSALSRGASCRLVVGSLDTTLG